MNSVFLPVKFFSASSSPYRFLPYSFKRLNDRVLLTNPTGEFCFLSTEDFNLFINKELSKQSHIYLLLKRKSFLVDDSSAHLKLLSSRFWTKKSFLAGFTKLHIFVLTLRCNCACTYCQASRQAEDASSGYDMSIEVARRSVEIMMKSPSPSITVEFQGGEPLLNYPVLKEVVLYAKRLNKSKNKELSFVVCTNLSLISEEMLDFFEKEGITISTSVDGPAYIHDANRCRRNTSARHEIVERNIIRTREALGFGSVSALMTTTRLSLDYSKEIIDEYVRLQLGSIFIRSLNPYGYAVKTEKAIGYSTDQFVDFYKKCFYYILELNKSGIHFPEAYAGLLLRKMLTPWTVGFVDLQSPTGNGFAVTVYNYDGDVYASDESRMLYEMGDSKFRLGSVLADTYDEIYFGQAMQLLATNGVAECLAGCSDCVYVPYCGADPVRHYATQRDAYGHRPSSSFCEKNRKIFDFLFEVIANCDKETENILWSWVRRVPVKDVELPEFELLCQRK